MSYMKSRLLAAFFYLLAAGACVQNPGIGSSEKSLAPMGTTIDVAYAARLWRVMTAARLVGVNASPLKPFFGGAKPHGMILEIGYKNIQVDDHTGFVVVKKNYDGEGVSEAAVARNRAKYLSSITVMFQREAGYDEDNQNWFWVKYRPNGDLFKKNIKGKNLPLAGRIFKGKSRDENGGCIYCHSSAGGGNYIFYREIPFPGTRR